MNELIIRKKMGNYFKKKIFLFFDLWEDLVISFAVGKFVVRWKKNFWLKKTRIAYTFLFYFWLLNKTVKKKRKKSYSLKSYSPLNLQENHSFIPIMIKNSPFFFNSWDEMVTSFGAVNDFRCVKTKKLFSYFICPLTKL